MSFAQGAQKHPHTHPTQPKPSSSSEQAMTSIYRSSPSKRSESVGRGGRGAGGGHFRRDRQRRRWRGGCVDARRGRAAARQFELALPEAHVLWGGASSQRRGTEGSTSRCSICDTRRSDRRRVHGVAVKPLARSSVLSLSALAVDDGIERLTTIGVTCTKRTFTRQFEPIAISYSGEPGQHRWRYQSHGKCDVHFDGHNRY